MSSSPPIPGCACWPAETRCCTASARPSPAASGPAGSVLAYRPDVYHRGTSLSAEGEARYLLHVAFKPVDTDWLGFHAWPSAAESRAWYRFVGQATPRQLTAVGFPEPGHRYWTGETLAGVAARYPRLDMTPWRLAAAEREEVDL